MQSPFFVRHLAVLALAALNCLFAAVWLRRSARAVGPVTLMALLLATLYELNASPGWRFDFFLLAPLYAVTALAWIIRMAAVGFAKSAASR